MEEILVQLPDDIAGVLKNFSQLEKSLLVSKLLKEKLKELAKLRKIVSKSQLTQEKADDIASKINESLAQRYNLS